MTNSSQHIVYLCEDRPLSNLKTLHSQVMKKEMQQYLDYNWFAGSEHKFDQIKLLKRQENYYHELSHSMCFNALQIYSLQSVCKH